MKTWRRPMAGWWRRNPFYVRYMLREASCLFIIAYALILLAGLYRLVQGEAAFGAWVAALRAPGALVFHGVALVFAAYHSWTWFAVMPKTLPPLPVPDRAIVATGIATALAASAALLWVSLG